MAAVSRVRLNGADFDFVAGAPPMPGYIKLVTPRRPATPGRRRLKSLNGMVITPDNRTLIISESLAGRLTAFGIDVGGGLSSRRVLAEGLGPDRIWLDADGAVWACTARYSIVRVAEGGEVLQPVEVEEQCPPRRRPSRRQVADRELR